MPQRYIFFSIVASFSPDFFRAAHTELNLTAMGIRIILSLQRTISFFIFFYTLLSYNTHPP